MKKLLLGSAAIAMGMAFAAPAAQAQGVTLDIGGHHKGYVAWSGTDDNVDQDGLVNNNTQAASLANGVADDDVRDIDWLRETEIHFTGEATLDNGLTVGMHIETDIDNSTNTRFQDTNGDIVTVSEGDDFVTEEAYAYFSGAWGRANFGKEDGAAYLLQVAAPSADSNIDGLRQYINPINFATGSPTTNFSTGGANVLFSFNGDGNGLALNNAISGFNTANGNRDFFDVDGSGAAALSAGDIVIARNNEYDPNGNVTSPLNNTTLAGLINDLTRFDYDHAQTGYDNKITYMTPVFNGFQMGASYTPDVGESSRDINGVGQNDVVSQFGAGWEVSARYEGQWDEVGIAFGGGYSHIDLEEDLGDTNNDGVEDGVLAYVSSAGVAVGSGTSVRLEDREGWNVGLDLDWMAFGLGASYSEQEAGAGGAFEADTWTVGADYTTGPFKFGINYYAQDRDFFEIDEIETERYGAGVVYTYGPGMTFRGSVNYTEVDMPQFGTAAQSAFNQDQDATSVLLGTQINF